MLRTAPWRRLPLTIRWLRQDDQIAFDPDYLPPPHMPVQFGPVKPVKVAVVSACFSSFSILNDLMSLQQFQPFFPSSQVLKAQARQVSTSCLSSLKGTRSVQFASRKYQ